MVIEDLGLGAAYADCSRLEGLNVVFLRSSKTCSMSSCIFFCATLGLVNEFLHS